MSNRFRLPSPRKRAKSPREHQELITNSLSEDSVMLTSQATQPAFSTSHAPLTPRALKGARSPGADEEEEEETEMRLLSEVDGRAHLDLGMDIEEDHHTMRVAKKHISKKDKQGMALLSILCEQRYVFGRHDPS